MKVGIMTCHDIFNPGSSLQAYALSRYLLEHGADAEIIDYKPDYMYRLIDFMKVDSVKWQKSFLHRWAYRIRVFPYKLSLIPKYCRYREFNKKYLPLTNYQFHTLSELRLAQHYDVLVCGSDQIWSSVKNKCGEDPAFYLDFAPSARKLAYAASFGASYISCDGSKCLEKYLPSFSAISVREKSGLQILKDHGFAATQVLDPVFLIKRGVWDALCAAPKEKPQDYVLVYGYDSSIDLDAVGAEYAERKGFDLISLKPGSPYAIGGPEQFLWLIKNARMVITSSFHAVAFSTIFETPFVSVRTGNHDLFERIFNILELTGLLGRLWNSGCDIDQLPPADFYQCHQKLEKAREESEKFLLGALYGSKDV